MFEFDLDACFNNISLNHTLDGLGLRGVPERAIIYLEYILSMFPLKGGFHEERELMGRGNLLGKKGLPQGLSVSPLLSIMVISDAMKVVNLNPVMYADDGVILCEKKKRSPFTEDIKRRLEVFGLVISDKKKKDGSSASGFCGTLSFIGYN